MGSPSQRQPLPLAACLAGAGQPRVGFPNKISHFRAAGRCGEPSFAAQVLLLHPITSPIPQPHPITSSHPSPCPPPGRLSETNACSFQGNKRKSQTGKVVMNNRALAGLMISPEQAAHYFYPITAAFCMAFSNQRVARDLLHVIFVIEVRIRKMGEGWQPCGAAGSPARGAVPGGKGPGRTPGGCPHAAPCPCWAWGRPLEPHKPAFRASSLQT